MHTVLDLGSCVLANTRMWYVVFNSYPGIYPRVLVEGSLAGSKNDSVITKFICGVSKRFGSGSAERVLLAKVT